MPFPKHFPVLMDTQSAIALACGPAAHHQSTQHIATKYIGQEAAQATHGTFCLGDMRFLVIEIALFVQGICQVVVQ